VSISEPIVQSDFFFTITTPTSDDTKILVALDTFFEEHAMRSLNAMRNGRTQKQKEFHRGEAAAYDHVRYVLQRTKIART
jgi:hypothetical protein